MGQPDPDDPKFSRPDSHHCLVFHIKLYLILIKKIVIHIYRVEENYGGTHGSKLVMFGGFSTNLEQRPFLSLVCECIYI